MRSIRAVLDGYIFSGFQTSSSHTLKGCSSGIRHLCRNVSRNSPTNNGGAFWGPHPACLFLHVGQIVAVWNMNFGDSCAMKSKYLKKCGHLSQDRPQSSLFSRWQHVWKLWAGNLIKCTFPEAIISAMTVIQPVFTNIGLDKLHSSTIFHDSQNFWNKGYFGEFPAVEDVTWRCVTLHPDWWLALPLALVWQHTFSHPQASLAVFCLPRGGEPTFFDPTLSTHSAQGLLVRFQGTGYLATLTALQLLLHPWPGEQHQHISRPLMANTPFERAEIQT